MPSTPIAGGPQALDNPRIGEILWGMREQWSHEVLV